MNRGRRQHLALGTWHWAAGRRALGKAGSGRLAHGRMTDVRRLLFAVISHHEFMIQGNIMTEITRIQSSCRACFCPLDSSTPFGKTEMRYCRIGGKWRLVCCRDDHRLHLVEMVEMVGMIMRVASRSPPTSRVRNGAFRLIAFSIIFLSSSFLFSLSFPLPSLFPGQPSPSLE